jgi:DNA-directed RNA polymerase specialized sigma24 family protein
MTKTKNNYVDNKRLYTEMVKYISAYNEAKEKDLPLPRVNNYIGKCIQDIAYHLSTNRNFIGYSYREEMIGDGIENTLRYIHNFDPDKTKNPFAYFTTIIYYAFLRRIETEKKQQYVKYKTMESAIMSGTFADVSADDAPYIQSLIETLSNEKLTSLSEKYNKKPKKEVSTKKKGIETLIGDEDDGEV